MPVQDRADPFAGPLALLGALVGTSVFSIGFLSHRSHAALTHARDILHGGGAPDAIHATASNKVDPSGAGHEAMSRGETERARNAVADAQSYLVLTANLVLVVLTLAAAASAKTAHMGFDGALTLVGFCIIECVIVALGFHDQARVRHTLNQDLRARHASVILESPRKALWNECRAGAMRRRDRGD